MNGVARVHRRQRPFTTSLPGLLCASPGHRQFLYVAQGPSWSLGTRHPLGWYKSSRARPWLRWGRGGPAWTLGWRQSCLRLLRPRQGGSGCEEERTSGPYRTHVPACEAGPLPSPLPFPQKCRCEARQADSPWLPSCA